jgi:hypothetical protein
MKKRNKKRWIKGNEQNDEKERLKKIKNSIEYIKMKKRDYKKRLKREMKKRDEKDWWKRVMNTERWKRKI